METCSQFKVVIDLEKMIESDIADWLKRNGRFICFNETHKIIEDAHKIKDQNVIDVIERSSPAYTEFSLGQIKQKIVEKGGNFDFDRYYCYLTFTNSQGRIDFDLLNDFDSDKNCYSIPLLRGIVLKNNFNDATIFEFAETQVNTKTTIIIRVLIDSSSIPIKYDYYDYSDEPKIQFMSM